MRYRFSWLGLGIALLAAEPNLTRAAEPTPSELAAIASALGSHQSIATQILSAAQQGKRPYQRLAELCDTFGPRITGSTNLEFAIDWVLEQLRLDGFSQVHGEPVQVPHWVRGAESLELRSPRRQPLRVLGVGGTLPTPPHGIEAEVLVVTDFAELKQRQAEAVGKIVLFDLPFTDYGVTVAIRTRGAMEAAKAGAVASLIRSVGPFSMQTPHTGIMQKDPAARLIPHAAITSEDAAMFRRMQERGQRIVVHLKLDSTTHPDATSRNVVAEFPGSELPEEIVLLGGHIDSWDVGQGAVDDGGGCIASWEAIRLLKELGLKPRRTLRLVLWTGEENGLWGAKAYRKSHEAELSKHVLAIESDRGVFSPEGFAFTGSGMAFAWLDQIAKPLHSIKSQRLSLGNGGMDVMELISGGVPVMDLVVDRTRYFWFHHSEADTVDKVDPKELNLCVGALAVMAHGVANMPIRLPR